MKREQLKKLELADEVIDKIMAMNGEDVESHKTKLSVVQTDLENANKQLTEANQTIEGFKKVDVGEIQKTADDYKAKFEQAQTDHAAALAKIEEDSVLDSQLKETYGVADMVAIKAHLNRDALKYDPKSKTHVGLKEQVDPLKEKHGAYFNDYKEPPKIITGGNNQSVVGDKMVDAARVAAGLVTPAKKE